MHIVGAIVGEHTYNVDAYDRLQTYYVKAAAYLNAELSFAYDGEDVDDFVERPEFAECTGSPTATTLWTCRERVWNSAFRGKTRRRHGLSQQPLRARSSSSPSMPARPSASASSTR